MLFGYVLNLILALLSSTQLVSAALSNPKACLRVLENAANVPQTSALKYMQRISLELRAQSPLLWTIQKDSVLLSFQNQFGVKVQLYDAMGFTNIPGAPLNAGLVTARANVFGEGFAYNGNDYQYEFIVWNLAGEMYYVKIYMDKDSAPMVGC